jgi:hypothetical protein
MEMQDYIFLEGSSYLARAAPIKVILPFRAFLRTNFSITAD